MPQPQRLLRHVHPNRGTLKGFMKGVARTEAFGEARAWLPSELGAKAACCLPAFSCAQNVDVPSLTQDDPAGTRPFPSRAAASDTDDDARDDAHCGSCMLLSTTEDVAIPAAAAATAKGLEAVPPAAAAAARGLDAAPSSTLTS